VNPQTQDSLTLVKGPDRYLFFLFFFFLNKEAGNRSRPP
jgi:hypothetical protein